MTKIIKQTTFKLTKKQEELLELKRSMLPSSFEYDNGCHSCAWRNDERCEALIVEHEGIKHRVEPGKVCNTRLMYLLSHMPNYEKKPTHSEFQRDLSLASATRMKLEEEKRYLLLCKEFEEFENKWSSIENRHDNKRYMFQRSMLVSERNRMLKNWLMLNSENLKYNDNQITRETTKKFDINVTNGLDRLRSTVLDAEIVKDDNK